MFPRHLYKSRNKMMLAAVYCIVSFCIGLCMVTEVRIKYIIIIYHKCEDGIKKSILMITVCHPEAVGSKVVVISLFTHCFC